jgi:hypothetical protein
MPIPPHIARIAEEISVTASPGNRANLRSYLAGVTTDEELFARCLKKALRALDRFNASDIAWLKRWLPIILKTVDESETR